MIRTNQYKKYLHLKYTNAGLIMENVDSKNSTIKDIMQQENVGISQIKRGHNFKNVISYTLLSNVLTSLMGGIPVPTKPSRRKLILHDINRPEICDEMAKNAYYKIDTPIDASCYDKQIVGKDGEYYSIYNKGVSKIENGEFFNAKKTKIDSNKKITTSILNGNDVEEIIPGLYNYNMLLRGFEYNENDELFLKIKSFIDDILGVRNSFSKYHFSEISHKIAKLSKNDDIIKNRINDFVNSIMYDWKNKKSIGAFPSWMYSIFHWGKLSTTPNTQSNNTGSRPKAFLMERTGADHRKLNISGEIIVEVTDKRVEDALRKNCGFCTILEGGVCTIIGLTNQEPIINYKKNENWTKIYDENLVIN